MKITLLDCTLRDGGYVNDFKFGEKRIKRIIKKLCAAKIDIIECGFLHDIEYDIEKTLFNNISCAEKLIEESGNYAAMVSFDDISIDKIENKKSKIEIIRVIFHSGKWEQIKENVHSLIQKGYKVFVQPMNTMSYSDQALLNLIQEINDMKPYAFYIVDSFGSMYAKDLTRIFNLADHNLNREIKIGFHSHNNLQLAFSNALALISIHTKREIIIDCSCFGMGRGAGNLPTELIAQYINDNIEKKYELDSLLEIIDDELLPIYIEKAWGYSVPYFLAASKQCHPNYASFLLNKQTITATAIQEIIDRIPIENKPVYDQSVIENLYLDYQVRKIDDSENIDIIKNKVNGRNILLIAPGQSIKSEADRIDAYIAEHNPLIIALNFIPNNLKPDILFVSNKKRFSNIDFEKLTIPAVVTSNIKTPPGFFMPVDYQSILFQGSDEIDNSGVMILQFMMRLEVNNVALAGFDGYTVQGNNYYSPEANNYADNETILKRTRMIAEQMKVLTEQIKITFITPSLYENFINNDLVIGNRP